MANEKEPTPGTRGYRVDQVRKALKLSRDGFAGELALVAEKLRLDSGGKWTPIRVSKTILERQPLSLEDAATVAALAEIRGLDGYTWDWLILGKSVAEAYGRKRKTG